MGLPALGPKDLWYYAPLNAFQSVLRRSTAAAEDFETPIHVQQQHKLLRALEEMASNAKGWHPRAVQKVLGAAGPTWRGTGSETKIII